MCCLYTSSLLYITGNFDSTDAVSNYSECALEGYIDHFYFLHLCLNNEKDIDTYELRLLYSGNNVSRLVIKKIILQSTGKILIVWFADFLKTYESFLASSQIQRFSLLFLFLQKSKVFLFYNCLFPVCVLTSAKFNWSFRNVLSQKWEKLYIPEKKLKIDL